MTTKRQITVPATASEEDRARTMSMLNEHVPISLILDIASPVGPDSEKLLKEESADTEDWIPAN